MTVNPFMKNGPFVILEHDWPMLHWDMLIDLDACQERVATWAINHLPKDFAYSGQAIKLTDHRRIYLNYEGPISGNRGKVERIYSGSFQLINDEGSDSSREIKLIINAKSVKLPVISGELQLNRISGASITPPYWPHRIDAESDWIWKWKPRLNDTLFG